MPQSSIKKATTVHHGHHVTWHETGARLAATVDGRTVTIQKRHKSVFQPSRGGKLAKADAPRYRVLVDAVFVAPNDGYRRDLKSAKDDGVAKAIAVAEKMKAAKLAARRAAAAEAEPSEGADIQGQARSLR